jgi:hypothetical protein
VYGFRVPLLVVSAYTPPHTISGPITGTPTYPQPKEWTHDFGSILKFTENNFLGPTAAIAPQTPVKYTDADQNSLDTVYQGNQVVPLWDFFRVPVRQLHADCADRPFVRRKLFHELLHNAPGWSLSPADRAGGR